MKRISFFCSPARFVQEAGRLCVGRGGIVPLMVDLESLSPTARHLADLISTTDRRDDFALVVVETDRDAMADLRGHVARTHRGSPERIEALVASYARMYGVVPGVTPHRFTWSPGHALRPGETPEAWFEHEARALDVQGARIVRPFVAAVA